MKAKQYDLSRNKITATRIGQSNESAHCVVYTIQLDPSVALDPAFAAKNPKHISTKECFYVGMTTLQPEERFAQHIAASRLMRSAVRLLRFASCMRFWRSRS